MVEHATEAYNDMAVGLDMKAPATILANLHKGQMLAGKSVIQAFPQIEIAADLVAATLASGGTLVYVAAGSSAIMALADGLELPGTFSVPANQIKILIAGGSNSLSDLSGGPEDDVLQAQQDVAEAGASGKDCMICLSASGSTPYVLAALDAAKKAGAHVIGIANNPQTPLLDNADLAIYLPTPPEVISGSTRLGAATAQKITLNLISTLMAIHLGHIHDGFMVNVTVDNTKLKKRAYRIVAAIGRCSENEARDLLARAGGSVKVAILLAAGAKDEASARHLLESNAQKLRPALSKLKRSFGSTLQGA
jgi:N-acetylmuramic acid 6-phosphate etherase